MSAAGAEMSSTPIHRCDNRLTYVSTIWWAGGYLPKSSNATTPVLHAPSHATLATPAPCHRPRTHPDALSAIAPVQPFKRDFQGEYGRS